MATSLSGRISAISAFCQLTPSISSRLVVICDTKPFIAILVPKLVATVITVTVTVTGTAGVKKSLLGLDSWIAAAEEVSLQTASEG